MAMMGGGGMEMMAVSTDASVTPTPFSYYEIIFSDEQIADFIESYAWAAELFDDDDENVSMQAYITGDGVFYEVNKDRPDGSHVEIGVDAAGKTLRHSTTDAQDRLTRFVAELLPDGGKVVFNVAYDDTGYKIVDEWIEYDSDGNMIEYWDLIAMEAEALQMAEEAGD